MLARPLLLAGACPEAKSSGKFLFFLFALVVTSSFSQKAWWSTLHAPTTHPHHPPPTNPPSPSLSALLLGKFTSVGKSRLVHNRSVFLDLFLFLRDCHQSRFSFNRNQPFSTVTPLLDRKKSLMKRNPERRDISR